MVELKKIYFAGKVDSYRSKLFGNVAIMETDEHDNVVTTVGGGQCKYAGPNALLRSKEAPDHSWGDNEHGLVGCDEVLPDDSYNDRYDAPAYKRIGKEAQCEYEHCAGWGLPIEEVRKTIIGFGRGGLTRNGVVNRCLNQIDFCDAVHAYIDSLDCPGTLPELGYAAAKGKPIYLVIDSSLQQFPTTTCSSERKDELWFIKSLPTVEDCRFGGPTVINPELLVKQPEPSKKKTPPVPPKLRLEVLVRDDYRCRICGASASKGAVLEVDHIVPKAKGGENLLWNLQTLCFDCNRGKSDSIIPVPD